MARLICQRVDLDSTGRTSQGSSYKVWLWSDQCPRFHSEPFPILHPAESCIICIRRYALLMSWWILMLSDKDSDISIDDQMPQCHTCQPAVSPMDAEPCWPAGWREQCRNLLPSWACALHHSSISSLVLKCVACIWSWSGLQKSENVGRRSSLMFLNHDVNNGWFIQQLGCLKTQYRHCPKQDVCKFSRPIPKSSIRRFVSYPTHVQATSCSFLASPPVPSSPQICQAEASGR